MQHVAAVSLVADRKLQEALLSGCFLCMHWLHIWQGKIVPGRFVLKSLRCTQGGDMASPAARSSGEVQLAYSALLEAALSQLQLLGADAGSSKQGKKAYQAAQDRLYSLLEALAQVTAALNLSCLCSTTVAVNHYCFQPLLQSWNPVPEITCQPSQCKRS